MWRTGSATGRGLVVLVCSALGQANALLADPLETIPRDVAGVIAFRNPQECCEALNGVLKKLCIDSEPLDLNDFAVGINLQAGAWRTTSPLILILSKPECSKASLVVSFVPKDPKALLEKAGGKNLVVTRQMGPEGASYFLMRDGVAYVSQKRKALRAVRRLGRHNSLAKSFDSRSQKMFERSDAFIYLSIDRWREKISPFVLLATNMMKLGATASSDVKQAAGTEAVMSWVADGAKAIVNQMESVSVGFDFDGKTLRLAHLHRFTPGQSVSKYLSSVEKSDLDLLSPLPDKEFLLYASANWRTPPGGSLAVAMTRQVLTTEGIAEAIPAEERKRLVEEMESCYAQIRGNSFVVAPSPGRGMPLSILGVYATDDAEKAVESFCFIQENASKALGCFMLGGGCGGKFVRKSSSGVKCMELKFDFAGMPEKMIDEFAAYYGKDVRYQNAALDAKHLGYCLAQPPTSIADLMKPSSSKNNLGQNPGMKAIQALLPKNPNLMFVVDLGRVIEAVPLMAGLSCPVDEAASLASTTSRAESAKSRPLLGWACDVGPSWVLGEFAINMDDAADVAYCGRAMAKRLARH